MPISKSYDQNNFALFSYLKIHQKNQNMFELFLQFSRSRASPVCKPSHMGKRMLKLLFKIDQNPILKDFLKNNFRQYGNFFFFGQNGKKMGSTLHFLH